MYVLGVSMNVAFAMRCRARARCCHVRDVGDLPSERDTLVGYDAV